MNLDSLESEAAEASRIQAEVICIGDELTSGQRMDTNSQWLSRELADIGIRARFHTTVGDDVRAMTEAIQTAVERSQVILMTGGLGPTADDLTRTVLADIAGVSLILNNSVLNQIRDLFRSRDREMPANNRVQAMFPDGSTVIANPTGTAPGIDILLNRSDGQRCRLFAFPGVPSELKLMWKDTVRPALHRAFPGLGTIVHHSIHCFGLAESDVETRLPDLIRRGRVPEVGITATKATITLRISAAADSELECHQLIQPTVSLIHAELSDFIFGENETTLQDVVVEQLRNQNRKLGILDAGNCGLVTQLLQQADPQGHVFRGCVSVPVNAEQWNMDFGCRWMDRIRDSIGCDLVLAMGPRMDRGGALMRQVLLSADGQLQEDWFQAASNPAIVQQRSIKQALNFLRRSNAATS